MNLYRNRHENTETIVEEVYESKTLVRVRTLGKNRRYSHVS